MTNFPPDDRFPYFLWRMAAWSEYASRAGTTIFKTDASPTLLDLCDQLPKDDDYYIEGRFLRARNLGLQKKFAAEAEIYRQLVKDEVLTTDSFKVANHIFLGKALEALGDFTSARAEYLTAQPYIAEYAMAAEGFFRSILISLELGEPTEAKRILGLLGEVSSELIALTENRVEIESLLALEDPEAYWKASESWWPQWKKLFAELLPDEKQKAVRVPAIGDLRAFGAQMGAPLRDKDRVGFYAKADLLLHALRWSPDFLNDSCSTLTFLAPTLDPDKSQKFRSLVIAICEAFPNPSPENLRRKQLYLAICLVDSERPEEALEITNSYFNSEPPHDPLFNTLTRIRALASLRIDGADLEIPAKGLEQLIAGSEDDTNRVRNVIHLANLYRKMKRGEEEEALLAKALKHPQIKADEAATAEINARYKSLASDGEGAKSFSTAVDNWLEKHSPAWLDHCAPTDLNDPRIGDDLETALREATSRFTAEEAIKLQLLASQSDQLDLAAREQAFVGAYNQLHNDVGTYRAARKMLSDALDQEGFPSSMKQVLLFSALDSAMNLRRSGDIAFVMAHPALDRDRQSFAPIIKTYGYLASTNLGSSKSVQTALKKLTDEELGGSQLHAALLLFQYLIELGDLPAAEAAYKSSGNWKLGTDVRTTKTAMKLRLLKGLKYARKSIPLNQSLHRQLAPMLPLENVEEPEWLSQRRYPDDTPDLTIAQAEAQRLFEVKEKRYDQSDNSFWFDVAEALETTESKEFAYKLLELYLAEADDDAQRSIAPFYAAGILDTDEPKIRARIDKIFAPYRDQASAPITSDAIRIYEIRTDKLRARDSTDFDIDGAFANISHPSGRQIQIRATLTQLIQKGDKPALRRYLEAMSADDLLAEKYLALTLRALPIAGLDDEAELARETAVELVPELLARGWRYINVGTIISAYTFAELSGKPELIPDALYEDLISAGHLKNERQRLLLETAHHHLHQDWPALEASATRAIKQFPTFYHFYLDKARALHQQGKTEEAQAPLEVYLKYSHNEVEIVEAKSWRKK